jgi:hypothetical protein
MQWVNEEDVSPQKAVVPTPSPNKDAMVSWPSALVFLLLIVSFVDLALNLMGFIRPSKVYSKIQNASDTFVIQGDVDVAGSVTVGEFHATNLSGCQTLVTDQLATGSLIFQRLEAPCSGQKPDLCTPCVLDPGMFAFYLNTPPILVQLSPTFNAASVLNPSVPLSNWTSIFGMALKHPWYTFSSTDPKDSYWWVQVVAQAKKITEITTYFQCNLSMQTADGSHSLLLDHFETSNADINTLPAAYLRPVQLNGVICWPCYASDGTVLDTLVVDGKVALVGLDGTQAFAFDSFQCRAFRRS